jgi:hypothetical protein
MGARGGAEGSGAPMCAPHRSGGRAAFGSGALVRYYETDSVFCQVWRVVRARLEVVAVAPLV